MKKSLLAAGVLGLSLLTSCGDSGPSRSEIFRDTVLNEGGTTSVWALVKERTETSGYSVFKNTETDEYVAFNVSKFDESLHLTLDDYYAVAEQGVDIVNILSSEVKEVYVEDGYYEEYSEGCDCWSRTFSSSSASIGSSIFPDDGDIRYVDTSYYRDETFYYGKGFVFSAAKDQSKDLEMMAALAEDDNQKVIANVFKTQFSLSSSRSAELADMVVRYNKISSIRSLTSEEQNQITIDSLGVEYNDLESAMKEKAEGRVDSYQAILEKASQKNETTPETIDLFFKNYL